MKIELLGRQVHQTFHDLLVRPYEFYPIPEVQTWLLEMKTMTLEEQQKVSKLNEPSVAAILADKSPMPAPSNEPLSPDIKRPISTSPVYQAKRVKDKRRAGERRKEKPNNGSSPQNGHALHHILLIGCCGVGISSLLQRYSTSELKPTQHTREDEVSHKFSCKGSHFQLHAPTGHNARPEAISERLVESKYAGIIVVYDITDADSLGDFPALISSLPNALPVMYVGNRLDLEDERELPLEKVRRRVNDPKTLVMEVSAKDNVNVKESMAAFADRVHNPSMPGKDE